MAEEAAARARPDGRLPRPLEGIPSNLPVQPTSFVGRQAELAAVLGLMARERLATLTGVGGCGKTRLAAQAAADGADRWPDGVWWVELGSVTDPASVPDVVSSVVGALVEPVQGPLRSLSSHLRGRRCLLCLDSCEHVLDATAEVAEVLRSCPGVSVLATSREPLAVPGEAVWKVPSLAEEDALSLMLERASRAGSGIALDASDDAALRAVCSRLDGIPLAIELAAVWLRTLTPRQIEAELDDRFTLLVRGARGAAARQRTLAASIDWSYDLLDEIDRTLFRRLAAFAGGFTLDAARSVGAGGLVGRDDVLDALGRLVDKSLVVAERSNGEARYRLLETIRKYAGDRLEEAGETAATQDRHLDHYLEVAEAAEGELERDRDSWRIRFELDHDNLLAALRLGLSQEDPERGRRLAGTLPWLWHLHGHGHEGIELLQRAIGRLPGDRSLLQGRLLAGLAMVADTTRPLDLELDAAQQALDIAAERGDERLRSLCLLLSAVGQHYTDPEAAWKLTLDAQRAAEVVDDGFVVDGARALQGMILLHRGQSDAARPLLEESFDGRGRRGDRGIAATVAACRSSDALSRGEVDVAHRLAEQAVQLAEPLGDYHRVATARGMLATLDGVAGNVEAGLQVMEPIRRLAEGAERPVFLPAMAWTLGTLHLWGGAPEEAVRWFERDVGPTDAGVDVSPGAENQIVAYALPRLGAALRYLGRLDEAADVLDHATTLARRLDIPGVLAEGLEQQGHRLAASDPDRAADLHHEALAIRVDHGSRLYYVDSLDALAGLAAHIGQFTHAVRLLAASDAARVAIGYPRRLLDRPAHEATLSHLRTELGDDAFVASREEGARMSLDDVVAYARRTRGSRGRPSTGWASLTPTEVAVVQLVVEGLNNQQIGLRLFMGRGTVKTHLSHVYAKLGVANRTELAALAPTHLPCPGGGPPVDS